MILQGTIVNALAVLLGAALGALLGHRLPDRVQRGVFVAIGLFTLFLGFKLALDIRNPLVALASLILAALLGSALDLEHRLKRWLQTLQIRMSGISFSRGVRSSGKLARRKESTGQAFPSVAPPGPTDANRQERNTRKTTDSTDSGDHGMDTGHSGHFQGFAGRRPLEGLLSAFLLFCVGSMTVLGCIQEGLGESSDLLLAKSVLDGVSSVALAAAFGGIIALVAFPLFVFQAILTLAATWIAPYLEGDALHNMNGVGGLLLLGLALEILELRNIQILNLLPALIFAPLLTNLMIYLPALPV